MSFERVELRTIVSHRKGFAFKSRDYKVIGNPVVRVSNFTADSISTDDLKFVNNDIAIETKAVELKALDIVIATVGSWPSNPASIVGKTIMVPSALNGALLNQNSVRLRVLSDSLLDQEYLFYALKNQEFSEYLISTAQGSANQASITLKDILNYQVQWPEETDRKKIVTLIGSVRKKIELNTQANQTLESIAQALFKSWFIDFDPVKAKIATLKSGGMAEDAELAAMSVISSKSLDELTELKQSNASAYKKIAKISALFPSSMQESELGEIPEDFKVRPFSELAKLDTTSVNPGKQATTLWEHYSIPSFDVDKSPALDFGSTIKSGKYRVQKSSVLSSKLNPHFPRTWWPDIENEERAICSTEFMQFVPHEEEYRSFIYGMITSQPFQEGMQLRVTGSTGSRQRAQPPQVASMDMVVPSDDLISLYSNKLLSLHQKAAKNIKENKQLSSLRDTLLPKLLSGEIDLSALNEEASEVNA